MKTIKVLGTGCANCNTTLRLIDEAARSAGVEVTLEKVEELSEIMKYGVMSTPGVVLEGQVVHAGGIPSKEAIAGWLAGATSSAGRCGGDAAPSGKCCS